MKWFLKFYSTTDKRLWPAASMSLLATLIKFEKEKKIFSKGNELEDKQKVWVYNNFKKLNISMILNRSYKVKKDIFYSVAIGNFDGIHLGHRFI